VNYIVTRTRFRLSSGPHGGVAEATLKIPVMMMMMMMMMIYTN